MNTVREIRGPTIRLNSGSYFSFLHPEESDFTIEEIATSLAHICRYNGQVRIGRFYSVAQHSVHCHDFAPPSHQYTALMHDAPEFAVGDMVRPLKDLCPDFRAVEARVEAAVFDRFNVPPIDAVIKEIDNRMLLTEQRQIRQNSAAWAWCEGLEPFPFTIPVWTPERAYNEFMQRFALWQLSEAA